MTISPTVFELSTKKCFRRFTVHNFVTFDLGRLKFETYIQVVTLHLQVKRHDDISICFRVIDEKVFSQVYSAYLRDLLSLIMELRPPRSTRFPYTTLLPS